MTATGPARRSSWSHNLGTVIAFEFTRTLRRRSFWALTLAVPVFMIGLILLVTFSSTTAANTATAEGAKVVPFTYTDASGLVDPGVAKAAGGTPTTDAAAARQAVIDGRSELFIAYPADPVTAQIEVVGRDLGIASSTNYGAIAQKVLRDSVERTLPDARVAPVLAGQTNVHLQTYAEGKVAPGFASVLLPGAFLVLFYMAIIMLGNQMLNITVEEKENRVTEMILTTIHPTTLIVGKLIALVAVGLVQAVVLMAPLMLAPVVLSALLPTATASAGAPDAVLLPTMADLSASVNAPAIIIGGLLFLGAFLLFTGLLVSIGAIMPTAKDAGSAFGVVIIVLFVPLYTVGILLTDPHGVASEILTFFPLTAPVTSMVRNATGTLLPWEAAITLVSIYATAAALLALGVRLFRTGSISYDQRLDVRKVLFRGKQTA